MHTLEPELIDASSATELRAASRPSRSPSSTAHGFAAEPGYVHDWEINPALRPAGQPDRRRRASASSPTIADRAGGEAAGQGPRRRRRRVPGRGHRSWSASAPAITHSSSFGLLEISAPGVTKATGLAELAAPHGIAADEVRRHRRHAQRRADAAVGRPLLRGRQRPPGRHRGRRRDGRQQRRRRRRAPDRGAVSADHPGGTSSRRGGSCRSFVFGSSSTNQIRRGYLYGAVSARTNACSSATSSSEPANAVAQHHRRADHLPARLVGHARAPRTRAPRDARAASTPPRPARCGSRSEMITSSAREPRRTATRPRPAAPGRPCATYPRYGAAVVAEEERRDGGRVDAPARRRRSSTRTPGSGRPIEPGGAVSPGRTPVTCPVSVCP